MNFEDHVVFLFFSFLNILLFCLILILILLFFKPVTKPVKITVYFSNNINFV